MKLMSKPPLEDFTAAKGPVGPGKRPSQFDYGIGLCPLPTGSNLYEIRFHGRGGQGTVVASVILAKAAFLEGRGVQAFPFFGVERRGAPVVAYTRVGLGPIRLACAVANPDALVVMDPSLLAGLKGQWERGLKKGGDILVNSPKMPHGISEGLESPRIAHIDAASIALSHGLGSAANPVVNTVILGAFAKFTGIVSLKSLEGAIRAKVPGQIDENLGAAREAFNALEWS